MGINSRGSQLSWDSHFFLLLNFLGFFHFFFFHLSLSTFYISILYLIYLFYFIFHFHFSFFLYLFDSGEERGGGGGGGGVDRNATYLRKQNMVPEAHCLMLMSIPSLFIMFQLCGVSHGCGIWREKGG